MNNEYPPDPIPEPPLPPFDPPDPRPRQSRADMRHAWLPTGCPWAEIDPTGFCEQPTNHDIEEARRRRDAQGCSAHRTTSSRITSATTLESAVPYVTNDELPPSVRNYLPGHGRIFIARHSIMRGESMRMIRGSRRSLIEWHGQRLRKSMRKRAAIGCPAEPEALRR